MPGKRLSLSKRIPRDGKLEREVTWGKKEARMCQAQKEQLLSEFFAKRQRKKWQTTTADDYFFYINYKHTPVASAGPQWQRLQGNGFWRARVFHAFTGKSRTSITKDNRQSILFDSGRSSSSKPTARVPPHATPNDNLTKCWLVVKAENLSFKAD